MTMKEFDVAVAPLTPIEAIRHRPAMYVGSVDQFGFINYLVSAVALLLSHRATLIDAAVTDDGFEIRSDTPIAVERNEQGRFIPFEEARLSVWGHGLDAVVLTALSEELSVYVESATRSEEWRYVKGVLASHSSTEAESGISGTTLRFRPDTSVFHMTEVPAAAFASYFRRLSFLHGGVRFRLGIGSDRQEFFAPGGIADLFAAIASPYQLMHEPIRIVAEESGLHMEVVLAYHSWEDNHLWCFINRGRAVQGGTHEEGFLQALKRLKKTLALPERFRNGVVAVAAFRYPGAVWEGCIKARVGNPELKPLVSRLVANGVVNWLRDNPSVATQLQQIQTFQFPEVWSDI